MQRSGLAVAVLALLMEEPMHPYRMQQLIKERGKDLVINVGQRSQLYKTIDRLVEAGLIVVAEAERERTSYAITESGRQTVTEWATEMIAAPRREFADFAAGLAYLIVLAKPAAIAALETRLAAVEAELGEMERELAAVPDWVPRIVLIESDYLISHLRIDREWISGLIDDLRTNRLDWDVDELLTLARKHQND
jgi:DNA-binding PadR family transcriptional regulator